MDKLYGKYDLNRLCSIKGLQSWLLKHKTSTINIADIGCGEGIFLKDFTDRISQKWDIDFGKQTTILLQVSNIRFIL